MLNLSNVKNNMKNARFHKKLTLDDISLATGIWQAKLSRIERGIFVATQDEKKKISKVLDSKIAEIFPDA